MANADVCLQNNQNNIITFNKHKSNVVGEASLGDQDAKNKHINKPMSNEISKYYSTFLKIKKDNKTGRRGRRPLQMPKSNFGITLIALIITIIVLLILAGVTLNMVMGERGLFNKANQAKTQTEVADNDEKIKLAALASRESTGDFNIEQFKKELETYGITENQYDSVTNSITVVAGNKKYIIDSDGDIIKEKDKGITPKDIQKYPSLYYGKTVNYTSENGEENWKIFYSDGEHIFLITSDYIKADGKDRINSNTGMTASGYTAYWSSAPEFQNVSDNILKRFKATGYNINEHKDNPNSKCVSTLLNQENWKKYLDKEDGSGIAEYAIGGPTIEMWMSSWNNLYENVDGKLYCDNTNENGYYVGIEKNPNTDNIDIMNKKKGINNKLFYISELQGINGYWLSSTSMKSQYHINNIARWGDIYGYASDYGLALRPVVSH